MTPQHMENPHQEEQLWIRAMTLGKILHIVAMAGAINACGLVANQPITISLAPKVPQTQMNIGRGIKLYLSVVDQRADNLLGYRQIVALWKYQGWEPRGTISASGNVAEVIQNSLQDGLTNLGFDVITAPEPSVIKLEISIQKLFHSLTQSRLNMVHNFYGMVTGKLYQGNIQLYERQYLHEREYRSFTAFIDTSWYEEQFNAALADCMGQLLADLELFNKLKL